MSPRPDRAFRPHLLELEDRTVPAWWAVTAPTPAGGVAGSTDATHAGELTFNPAYEEVGGVVTVWADTAEQAVTKGLRGTVTVTLGGVSHAQAFGPATVGAGVDGKAFALAAAGSGGMAIALEDMAGFPGATSDNDYNDRSFPGVTVAAAADPEVHEAGPWTYANVDGNGTATVRLKVTRPSEGEYRWVYTVTNNTMTQHFTSPGLMQFRVLAGDASLVGDQKADFASWTAAVDGNEIYWRVPCGAGGPYLAQGQTTRFWFDTPPVPIVDGDAGVTASGQASGVAGGPAGGGPSGGGPGTCMSVDSTSAEGEAEVPGAVPSVSASFADEFIPINADTDNFVMVDPVTNKPVDPATRWLSAEQPNVPKVRDFDVNNREFPGADEELVKVTITVTGNLPGTVTISAFEDPFGYFGRVRFWEDQRKKTKFTSMQVGGQGSFYIWAEGFQSSSLLHDVIVTTKFVAQAAAGKTTYTDTDYETVTPVVDRFTATARAGTAEFVNQAGGVPNGQLGITSGTANNPAIQFVADVLASGDMHIQYIQNIISTTNGAKNHGAAIEHIPGTSLDEIIVIDPDRIPAPDLAAYPLLDADPAAANPYYGHDEQAAGVWTRYTTDDYPAFTLDDPEYGRTVARIDYEHLFKMHLVVAFDEDGSIYPLAEAVWKTRLYADGWTPLFGMVDIGPDSVTTVLSVNRPSANPPAKTRGPSSTGVLMPLPPM